MFQDRKHWHQIFVSIDSSLGRSPLADDACVVCRNSRNSIERNQVMTRTKLGVLGLCAMVLGMMAISASSAQAALTWLILNKAGTAVELKALLEGKNDTADITLLTKEVGIKFAVTCTGFTLGGINLEAAGKLTSGGKIKFTGCEIYGKGILEEPLGCHLHSAGQVNGTVLTGEGKGELVLHELASKAKEVLTKLEPVAGSTGTFATFQTSECVIPESNPVHGVIFLKDCEGKATTHLKEHLLAQGPLTSMWLGADNAEHLETSIDGSIWIFLGGEHTGLLWGAMDV
jgi:hypothetical protein